MMCCTKLAQHTGAATQKAEKKTPVRVCESKVTSVCAWVHKRSQLCLQGCASKVTNARKSDAQSRSQNAWSCLESPAVLASDA